jgi:molecular chaperone GrpE
MTEAPPQAEPQPTEPQPSEAAEKSLDQLLTEAQAKIDEQREAWLRALADAENARKRAQSEVQAAHRFAIERFAESLLPVMDSLEAALGAESVDAAALKGGVELTLKQLRGALERARVAEISPAAGERFDPHRHQAMAAVESDAEPNSVVAVIQKGYSLHERVIRPALVTVAKARPANDTAPA